MNSESVSSPTNPQSRAPQFLNDFSSSKSLQQTCHDVGDKELALAARFKQSTYDKKPETEVNRKTANLFEHRDQQQRHEWSIWKLEMINFFVGESLLSNDNLEATDATR